jgi:hypothetical protein
MVRVSVGGEKRMVVLFVESGVLLEGFENDGLKRGRLGNEEEPLVRFGGCEIPWKVVVV